MRLIIYVTIEFLINLKRPHNFLNIFVERKEHFLKFKSYVDMFYFLLLDDLIA